MIKFKNDIKLHIILIILLSVSLRLIGAYTVGHKFHPQEWEYGTLAKNLIENGEYSMNFREYGIYKAVIAPGYTFLIFSVYKIFGYNQLIMLFLQCIFMTAFSLVLYWLAYLFFKNEIISFIAAVLSILHPGILYYSTANIHNFNLYIPLFYSSALLFCLCYKKGEWKHFIMLGLVSGSAILTRGTYLPIFMLSLLILLFLRRNKIPEVLPKAVLASFLAFSINVPWVIRNYIQFDKIIYSQSTKWEQFWVGNNPEATGTHFKTDGTTILSHKPPEMQKEIDASDSEIKDDAIFRKYSLMYIKENPMDFIKGLFKKGVLFWWFYPQTGLFYPKTYLVIYKALYVVLLIFTGMGIYICNKEKLWHPEMLFPAVIVFGIWIVHTVNFGEMRHRWTVEPVLIIFASLAIYRLFKKFKLKLK